MVRLSASGLAFALLALALASPRSALAQVAPAWTVGGRVLDGSSPGVAQPVPCCEVLVSLRDATGAALSQAPARTRVDGTFTADLWCFAPPPTGSFIDARPSCCSASTAPYPVSACPPPGPPTPIDLGDAVCPDPPQTLATSYQGTVLCRTGVFLDPVADCAVLVEDARFGPFFTRTDAAGNWDVCVNCFDIGPTTDVRVTAQCCGLVEDPPPQTTCPTVYRVPTMACPDCTSYPCPDRREVEVRGNVACHDSSPPSPMGGCDVRVRAFDWRGRLIEELVTTADGTGQWLACLSCGASPENASWTIEATPLCCGDGVVQRNVLGCEPVLTLPENACGTAPGSTCTVAPPCAPNDGEIRGRVTCFETPGVPRPVDGCAVLVESCVDADGDTVCEVECTTSTVFTDANGDWSACVPCACPDVTVTPLCCGTPQRVTVADCTRPTVVDTVCTSCTPSRPCPGPNEVLASGVVTCPQPGGASPLAGCVVTLTTHDGAGGSASPVTAVTDGEGRYERCVPCAAGGTQLVDARAECCDVTTTTDITGCPARATLEPLACGDCSPCPAGFTRLQGRVRCRGGGPVEGCQVIVLVECAGSVTTHVMATDREGRYRACIPCPCPGATVRVIAGCCRASRTLRAGSCGPVLPVPTLFCESPCR